MALRFMRAASVDCVVHRKVIVATTSTGGLVTSEIAMNANDAWQGETRRGATKRRHDKIDKSIDKTRCRTRLGERHTQYRDVIHLYRDRSHVNTGVRDLGDRMP